MTVFITIIKTIQRTQVRGQGQLEDNACGVECFSEISGSHYMSLPAHIYLFFSLISSDLFVFVNC